MRPVHQIRSFLLLPYLDELERKLGNPERLAASFGLKLSEIGTTNHQIPFARFLNMIQAVADRIQDSTMGLRLGAEIRPEQVGSLGILMSSSASLADALEQFARWAASIREGWALELADGESGGEYIYRILVPNAPVRHDVEYSLANLCSLIRTRMGADWHPDEVHFRHSRNADLRLYNRIFRCPVYFDQEDNKLVIAQNDLRRRSGRVNEALRSILDAHFREFDAIAAEKSLSEQVSAIVARRLGQKPVTVPLVAQELGISARSLQRRLAGEGTSLRAILRDQRLTLAETMLTHFGRATVTDIAIRSGYSDVSALSRAVRRWTGDAPRALWRKPGGHGPSPDTE